MPRRVASRGRSTFHPLAYSDRVVRQAGKDAVSSGEDNITVKTVVRTWSRVFAVGVVCLAILNTAPARALSHAAGRPLVQPPYTIDLSNTSLNNGWRLEMQSIAAVFARTAPYNKLVKLRIVNAPNDVTSQIASLNSMIAARVNAIIIDADSPTALNPVIARAVRQGIVVIAIDSTVTSPDAYTIAVNLTNAAYTTALWLAKSMHGKGNVVIDQGIVGTQGEAQQEAGVRAALGKFPGIKIIDEFSGQWATAPSEAGMARVLATYPKIDGAWSSGGEIGIIEALQHAHHALIPVAGFPFNKYLQQCVQLKRQGLQCGAASNPCYMSAQAIQEAVSVLQGKTVARHLDLPYVFYANNGIAGDVAQTPIVQGKTTFTGIPDEFAMPFNPPGAQLKLGDVIKGM